MSLMQVSRRVDYALRAAIHLARQEPEQPASVSEISEVEGIPKKFLEKILQDLIQDGVVVSRRGARGGYLLARSPDEVSFQEVMEAVEGPLALNVCIGENDQCSMSSSCGMRRIWAEGQRRLDDLFSATKLADLIISAHPAQISEQSSANL
ncbi:MAG: Rrf2 family transcriptional regulator [Candidatus Binatia bacterium]|nr:Rrf2 family transcriptional regulator [Candidatus Binatia bacterium]MDG1958355.1 Rrf2 family transcriptional regulator [Candidatus Binatia bacterium]MDG2009282.1 Rrf2 family transcriptional regulator [Candidatus Binatia bacterium]HAC80781.1 Rrf2 family transcriptional regulator [Deltaproteobacteria bacterium]|tara:strand:+ start:201 stop:653 length:453 start_codon:yes stop_codon:yes gene_type:complete